MGSPSMSETPLSADEELVKFLSAAVPRTVPRTLAKRAEGNAAAMSLMIFGAIFLVAGVFFAKTFLPWRQADEWRLSASNPVVVSGRIVAVGQTNMSINKQRVMRYDFAFVPEGSVLVDGECFTTGRRWTAGAVVNVRYDPANPSLACPAGARLSEGSLSGAFVLVFPLAGGGILFFSIRARRRALWLLTNGTLGDFHVTGIEPTSVTINKLPQFKITLQRLDQVDAEPHEVRWYKPELLAFARERLASGQAVFGLFDPAKPKRVLLPEAWSARV